MESPIYYSSIVENLYTLKEDSPLNSNNQSNFVSNQYGKFMVKAQEQHNHMSQQNELILEQLRYISQDIQQKSMQNLLQQGRINTSLDLLSDDYHSFKEVMVDEFQNLTEKVDVLTDAQVLQQDLLINNQPILHELKSLPSQLEATQNRLITSQNQSQNHINERLRKLLNAFLSEQKVVKNSVQNLGTGLANKLKSQNDSRYNQLFNTITQLKVNLEKQNPYELFQFGDRITIIDINGNILTGVYIENTENEIIWVNDATTSISITNTKGTTISKG